MTGCPTTELYGRGGSGSVSVCVNACVGMDCDLLEWFVQDILAGSCSCCSVASRNSKALCRFKKRVTES